jgi:hypothetical protein
MGALVTRFRRQKTTIERLEELEKDIKEHEKYKHKNDINEKKYIGALLLYSILLYIIGAFIYYLYLIPKSLLDRFKTLTPFFITPLIIFGLRTFLKWFFIKRNTYYEQKLIDLQEEKKTILEEVKEKETYKKAREILERFSNGVVDITPPITPSQQNSTPLLNQTHIGHINNGNKLVKRNIKEQMLLQNKTFTSPLSSSNENLNRQQLNKTSLPVDSSVNIHRITSPPLNQHAAPPSSLGMDSQSLNRTLLPRPVIAPNRTFFDKLLDFVIGEGPNNRYALICKSCHFHNGMALKEEFEYICFRCAYCLFYNEARKKKLTVPGSSFSSINQAKKFTNDNEHQPRQLQQQQINQESSSNHNRVNEDSTLSSNSLDDLNDLSDPISLPSSISDIKMEKLKCDDQILVVNNDKNINTKSKSASKPAEKLANFESDDFDLSDKENNPVEIS